MLNKFVLHMLVATPQLAKPECEVVRGRFVNGYEVTSDRPLMVTHTAPPLPLAAPRQCRWRRCAGKGEKRE